MNVLVLICYGILSLFSLASIIFIVQIFRAYIWIKRSQKELTVHSKELSAKIYVVIPVLDEKDRLGKTIDYFVDSFAHLKNLKIVIVTTEKEYGYSAKNNTIDLAKKIAKTQPNVIHIHYEGKGKMAHQLNYAMSILLSKNEASDCLYAFYNADSRPHQNTFKRVLNYKNVNPSAQVFQQYGDYSKNLCEIEKGFRGTILASAAAWQSRWSLGFEIPHALDQYSKIRYNKFMGDLTEPMNYCIGHGLILDKETYLKLNGFSEDTHNEDAIMGLELSYLNKTIVPIPFFDGSDAPDSLNSLYKQKSNWFFGPFQAFNYMKKIEKRNKISSIKLKILSFKLFTHALRWMIGPTLMFAGFLLSMLLLDLKLFLAMLIISISYLSLINYLGLYMVNSFNNKTKIKRINLIKIMIGSIPCYFMHGLSAYRAIMLMLISKITKNEVYKGKTEMRRRS